MTITDIIRNEIENSLGHNPSKEEQSVMMDYIHDAIADKINEDKKVYLVDVEFGIKMCRDEQFKQCEECGDWFLLDDMNEFGYKCQNCQPNHCEDLIEKDYE